MRPKTNLDWVAYVLVIIGAIAWGFFTFDVNILDIVLEAIWDPLDNIVFALIAIAGLYLLYRTVSSRND